MGVRYSWPVAQRPNDRVALEILRSLGVPPNVLRHSAAVAAVAFHLASRLRERGLAVDPATTRLGALLHDLDKASGGRPDSHGQNAGQILQALGHPDLARIAQRHPLRAWTSDPPQSWEEKIVHYADKVVEEDRVVGLQARLEGLRQRYPGHAEEIGAAEPHLRRLEEEIARALNLSPDQLTAELLAWPLDLALAQDLGPAYHAQGGKEK